MSVYKITIRADFGNEDAAQNFIDELRDNYIWFYGDDAEENIVVELRKEEDTP